MKASLCLAGAFLLLGSTAWAADQTAFIPTPMPESQPPTSTFGPHAGSLGLSFGITTDGADLALGYVITPRAQLRMDLGLSTQPYVNNQGSTFGFQLGLGMRMYLLHAGNLHGFVQPGIAASKTMGVDWNKSFALGVGADLGAEYFFRDQLSLSGQGGLTVGFAQGFDVFAITTARAALMMNFYL